MIPHLKKRLRYTGLGVLAIFALATALSLRPINNSFDHIISNAQDVQITDRYGEALTISYQTEWNSFDHINLYDVPETLKSAFLLSEDQNFFHHHGIDWPARFNALKQNIQKRQIVRGASTITEQVVRMVNPRPRNLWSKWLEGIEAMALERHAAKADILEFYFNQIPYAANRRGIVQAARYYFGRDVSTLSQKEMLALAVLARAPSSYDLYRASGKIDVPLQRLAARMNEQGLLTSSQRQQIVNEPLATGKAQDPVEARHFARYVRLHNQSSQAQIQTTLDAGLQAQVQTILDQRVSSLKNRHLYNGAAVVIDHHSGEILAWAVAGAGHDKTPGHDIDAVTTPRQPGSALKPFLYTLALDNGWTAATMLDDSPLAEAVGSGLHRFRNYSNTYYGPITLREALGNSLNIPAILTIHHVGAARYLSVLHDLGFESLDRGADIYDEGLALGNGEVTLLELAQAYTALANRGLYRPLRYRLQQSSDRPSVRVYSDEASSLMANILSDPHARKWEFGNDSVLNLPVQTATKTGTSTDYRDAWSVGFNDRYVVALWMGNLDRTPTENVTGSTGPALAMRSIFSVLNRSRDTRRLYFSPALVSRDVCVRQQDSSGSCPKRTEWFMPNTLAGPIQEARAHTIELIRPTDGLQMAYDPRVPSGHQKFRFELGALPEGTIVEWILDGVSLSKSGEATHLWPVQRGKHTLEVRLYNENGATRMAPVRFAVK